MEIRTLSIHDLNFIPAICLDRSVGQEGRKAMQKAMETRIDWIKKMMKQGLEIIVALEKPRANIIYYKWVGKVKHSDLAINGKVPMGLLEFMPIELALEPVKGINSLFINCMWILPPFWGKGVAKALMTEFIQKAKVVGSATILAYDKEKWFDTSIDYMPSEFFKKFGFDEIDRDGKRIILYLDLGSNKPPVFIKPKTIKQSLQQKKVIELFYNSQCPWSGLMVDETLSSTKENHELELRLINTDNRKIIEKFGISRGVRINGIPCFKKMISWDKIKEKIV